MKIGELNGVGLKSAPFFRELGIETSRDLLDYLPFRYEDLRFPTPANLLGASGGEDNAVGTVTHVKERRVRGLEIVEVRMRDEAGEFGAKWIGRNRYVYGRIKEGMRLFVRGRVERTLAGAVINVTHYTQLREGESYRGEMVPVYRASKDLTTRKIAAVVRKNLPALLEEAGEDPLPEAVRANAAYPSLRDSYRAVHAPATPEEAERARERFIFTEFLVLAAGAQLRRAERERAHDASALERPRDLLDQFQVPLDFPLTGAQRHAIDEIWRDMTRDVPMNRLLQGDVGSGKTLVAAAAVVLAARNGIQSALMAPTEILAAQHASKLAPLLLPFGITVEAVFGAQGARARNAALDRLASGEALLAVGTHALLTGSVDFARLGLVIIDEQHRFGVEQRARLRAKGIAPHTLHMTATPIPRTLAQSVYADLDLSVIDELPPGRTPIETYAIRTSRLERAYAFVEANVARGHQAYIVAPAIDEESELTSVIAESEHLKNDVFPQRRIGVVHGRLTSREKDEVMGRFVRGEIDILLATTVVEVGVDVPNASVMVVLDAHRYGLAQLHQLRGRIGRGVAKSFCVLVYPDETGESERLGILTESTDGFAIAEADLRLRGAGEFAGTVQSGAADLWIADLVRDIEIYREARTQAERIIAGDPALRRAEHAGLRNSLERAPSTRALVLSS
ncbi:MAG TPA: ATP-dependent DNA helicase RecG [Candidatus Baltobacteraceae bacterium]|nr:ATP-dependent DNA helicase RecG [Candidatus Baltobacteraceae bacterium]